MKRATNIQNCERCGTCCKKGGPSFHVTDKMLIEMGTIHTRNLYTIRRGEKVRDDILSAFIMADSDIIKIKGKDDAWTCRFYDLENKACAIYEQRPMECRVLKCWDAKEIEALYNKERLKREDLLKDIEGLWSLIEDHEQRCSYEKIARAMKDLEGNYRETAVAHVMEMVLYDMEIRRLVVEKGDMEAGMTDFLFGRPLAKTITMYGYGVKTVDGKYKLVKM